MNKKKCEVCGSSHTVKNGVRKGVQLYKCQDCGHQFRAGSEVSECDLWDAYQQGKQTIRELSERFGKSVATIKRRLHDIKREWVQPSLSSEGFVHLDVTYWGRGYTIRGLIIDGKQSLFKAFSGYHIQMCQFHMKQIIRRYLTLNPKMYASRELKELVDRLHKANEADFKMDYQAWKEKWKDTIWHKSLHKDGKMHYTHQRLRAAMNSLNFYLPYLFTYQLEDCKGMPNTNNKIEGTFTDLKKNLNNHSGLTQENRKRFISGFFLALESKLERSEQDGGQRRNRQHIE